MNPLDDMTKIHSVDRCHMLALIENFSDQIAQAEKIGNAVSLDSSFSKGVTHIVFSGLGGSAIGADLVRSYLSYDVPIPMFVNRHYRLPAYVDEKTLLVVSSYSGSTEETLASLEEGIRKKAKILAISSGGELSEHARRRGFPLIKIPGGFPPRAALGYSVFPLLVALSKIGFPKAYRAKDVLETRELVRSLSQSSYGPSCPHDKNMAKQFASSCFEGYPVIYGSTDFFDVVALRWRGQFSENAKCLASHHVLPEMNHNELVGWKKPESLLKKVAVFILRDQADHPRVQKRMDLTREIIRPLAGHVFEVRSQGESLLARIFSLVHLGDWISFYLAVLNGVDPTPVEVIQHLKSELAKESV